MSAAGRNTCFAFDLDGTVTAEEILPVIAVQLGLEREMRTLTDLTLSGAINFRDSFVLRCALLRAVPVSVVQEVVAEIELAEDIVAFIRSRLDQCALVTGNLDAWILPISQRLGCRVFSSRARRDGDQLLSVAHVLTKSEAISGLRTDFERIVAVGDSVNDVPMFACADIRVAFGGVHEPAAELVRLSDYVTYRQDALCRLLTTLS